MGVPLYFNEVKGYVPRPRIIWSQIRWKYKICIFWKIWSPITTKHDLYVNATCEPLTRQVGQVYIVKFSVQSYIYVSFYDTGVSCKLVEVHLQPNLICRCNMWTPYSVNGWGLVRLSGQSYFMQLLWCWNSLQVTAALPGGLHKFTCCIFKILVHSTNTFICVLNTYYHAVCDLGWKDLVASTLRN